MSISSSFESFDDFLSFFFLSFVAPISSTLPGSIIISSAFTSGVTSFISSLTFDFLSAEGASIGGVLGSRLELPPVHPAAENIKTSKNMDIKNIPYRLLSGFLSQLTILLKLFINFSTTCHLFTYPLLVQINYSKINKL